MNHQELIQSFQRDLQQAGCDAKAEVLLLLALEKGLRKDHFMVNSTRLFQREYSRDVVSSELKEDAAKQPLLQVMLSRGGLYDQLPEGLFFQLSPSRNKTVTDLAAEYKYNKKKETEVRRFFQPFENEFFGQRINIEEEETVLLEGLQSGMLNDYFIRFWDLPVTIPKKLLAPLILLLPYASTIAGDWALTSQSLELILQEPVIINKKQAVMEDASITKPPALGEGISGLDMVCGDHFWEDAPVVEIAIGPLCQSQISEYLVHGSHYTLLQTFMRFIMPAGVETQITILVAPEERHMHIVRDAEPVLGYSTYL
jgi:hypothetical protein